MKTLVFVLALSGIALSIPLPENQKYGKNTSPEEPIPIVSQLTDSGFDGTFTNNFETGNGITVEQSAVLKTIPDQVDDKIEKQVQEVIGSYSYTAPDGTPVKIEYIANENGFQAQGDVLPIPPQPSPIIARALKFIEEHKPTEDE
nr:endocuticle structural glycoprotein SgAbd-8-like [Onthophagus taurus]